MINQPGGWVGGVEAARPMQHIGKFTAVNMIQISYKNVIFFIFFPKHILWVQVKTVSMRRYGGGSNMYPRSLF